ncbi:DNA-binding LacI/PurR family transcriptional regulator [Kibdelosporangium banguiense]|uniref:DNA-binding LacI/PurR family transcriptional regulator n=1 Tax=Kibdelosporangium banguiense TaxID=1365924 RepID=A0ABS4TSH7_9PSEU|nr:LacI family DNA-binding transcriptional regulator [Kibdelosporangium banguiense]MBP2326846.1 DNA-binding LacI/PurR family transcriptional regulator [Kibdelosporangium banguiense]
MTLRQVASHAGVSRQTVSNVLNAPERVDPTTLAKVQAAIEALGYQPNRTARSLATRQAGLIGYGLAGSPGHSLFMDPFLHMMTESIERTGRHVLLFTATPGLAGLQTYADLIAQRAVDAFILSDTVDHDPRHSWLASRGVPFASFGRAWPDEGEQPGSWVDVDGAKACAELVSGLHACGHTRIAFVGWQSLTSAGSDRQRGWRAECERLGLAERDCVAVSADTDSTEGGARAAAALLDSAVPPTAIVAVSDLLAVGVLGEVRRRGLVAGRDVAVTGFDDSLLAAAVDGGLTSVRQPTAEIAATLVGLLETPDEERGVLLPGEVVVRGSAPLML